MPTLSNYQAVLVEKSNTLEAGTEFSLAELFGEKWAEVEGQGAKRKMGSEFRQAVDQRKFPQIEFLRIATSGRHNVFRKA